MKFDPVPMKIRDAYAARHEPEAEHVLATWYWAVCIVVLALTILGGVGYGAWEFFKPAGEQVEASVTVGTRKTISRADLQKVLEAFDARAARFETKLRAPASAKDPS